MKKRLKRDFSREEEWLPRLQAGSSVHHEALGWRRCCGHACRPGGLLLSTLLARSGCVLGTMAGVKST